MINDKKKLHDEAYQAINKSAAWNSKLSTCWQDLQAGELCIGARIRLTYSHHRALPISPTCNLAQLVGVSETDDNDPRTSHSLT